MDIMIIILKSESPALVT